MLFVIVILFLLFRRRWYHYGPYWNQPYYRSYGPYGPAYHGYTWNGYSWQPGYGYAYGYPYRYGCYRRGSWW